MPELVKGLFLPRGPFSLIDVRSFFAAGIVFLFFFMPEAFCEKENSRDMIAI